jgi:hypothetical protein
LGPAQDFNFARPKHNSFERFNIHKMAPPAQKDTSQADADFLFHVLAATDELKINWKTVASAVGISAYNNA